MTLEQRLRENLSATADALVVPSPQKHPSQHTSPARRHRAAFAAAGALAVVAMIMIPAILITPEEPPQVGTLATAGDDTTGSTVAPIAVPSTMAPQPSTTIVDDVATLAERSIDGYQLLLRAERTGDEEMAVATLSLVVADDAGMAIDETIIGEPESFFWYPLNGEGGVCTFTAVDTDGVTIVSVQPLLSASLGCSDPYVYELTGEGLVSRALSPQDAAILFVEAWQTDSASGMEGLATPEAIDQAAVSLPETAALRFQACEGTAGTVYCTWMIEAAATPDSNVVVVAVSTDPGSTPKVREVSLGEG